MCGPQKTPDAPAPPPPPAPPPVAAPKLSIKSKDKKTSKRKKRATSGAAKFRIDAPSTPSTSGLAIHQ